MRRKELMVVVLGTFILAGLALSAPFGLVTRTAEQADQGFYRDRAGSWKYVGEAKLTDWQVHVTVGGKRVVCEHPTIYDTEVITCSDVLQIDEAVPEAPKAPPRKTAYAPIPEPFFPDQEPAYDLEARIDRIYEGLEPRKK
jgi:hypothetical protein